MKTFGAKIYSIYGSIDDNFVIYICIYQSTAKDFFKIGIGLPVVKKGRGR